MPKGTIVHVTTPTSALFCYLHMLRISFEPILVVLRCSHKTIATLRSDMHTTASREEAFSMVLAPLNKKILKN